MPPRPCRLLWAAGTAAALSTAARRLGSYTMLRCREGCRLTGCSGRDAPAELPHH